MGSVSHTQHPMVEVARRRVAPVVPTVAQTEAAYPDAVEETEAAAIAAASAAPPSIGAASPAELKMIAKVSEGQQRSAKGSKVSDGQRMWRYGR